MARRRHGLLPMLWQGVAAMAYGSFPRADWANKDDSEFPFNSLRMMSIFARVTRSLTHSS
jgi:hypothetical protein